MSSSGTIRHPVYRSLNRPLLIAGVERRLFFLVLGAAAATLNLFESLLTAVLMFAVLHGLARWAAAHDQADVRALFNSARLRPSYDPARLDWRRPC